MKSQLDLHGVTMPELRSALCGGGAARAQGCCCSRSASSSSARPSVGCSTRSPRSNPRWYARSSTNTGSAARGSRCARRASTC